MAGEEFDVVTVAAGCVVKDLVAEKNFRKYSTGKDCLRNCGCLVI